MSQKIALLDMDGTVADYDGAVVKELNKIAAPGQEVTREFGSFGWQSDKPWLEARRHLVSSVPGFWLNLERLKIGFEIYEELVRQEFAVNVLTKGPSSKPLAWDEKIRWCREHLPGVPVTITEDKSLTYGRILVDDWPEYFMSWLEYRPRGLAIVPAQPWNLGCEDLHPNIYRYDGLDPERLSEVIKIAAERISGEPLII